MRHASNTKMYFEGKNCTDTPEKAYSQECQFPDTAAREFRRAYYAAMTYTDYQVGKVMAELYFNSTTATPHWDDPRGLMGVELYDHRQPTVNFNDENVNMAHDSSMKAIVEELQRVLRAGWRDAKVTGFCTYTTLRCDM